MDELKTNYITKCKKLKLLEAGIDYEDINTYVKYLTSDDEQEIERQAQEIVEDVKAHMHVKPNKNKNSITLF